MIHIKGNYYIDWDERSYTLLNKCKTKSADGPAEETFRPIGYWGTVEGCLKACRQGLIKETLTNAGDIGLAEATRLIVEETRDLKKIFKEIKNEICA